MITGDYPATARAIARQAGLDAEDLVTGEELEQLSEARVGAARAHRDRVRADHAGAEAPHRQRAQGERRDRGHDRRRRQRCALAQGGAYRHCHGRTRHRRGARGVLDRPARRRLRLDRQGGPARPPHLRQPAQGDGLHLRRACADRRAGAAAAAVWPADPVRPDAHRVSGDGDRSGVFAGLRGRDGGGRCHAPSAARARCSRCSPAADRLESVAGRRSRLRSLPSSSSWRSDAACRRRKCGRWLSFRWC